MQATPSDCRRTLTFSELPLPEGAYSQPSVSSSLALACDNQGSAPLESSLVLVCCQGRSMVAGLKVVAIFGTRISFKIYIIIIIYNGVHKNWFILIKRG